MNPALHIALCCNGTMLPGLHATLGSLVRNLSRREHVILTLFFQDMNEAELEAVRGTVADAGGVNSLDLRKTDVSDVKGLKALHGDWMTYLRLYLPRLLPDAATVLYLDSDLVVNTDVCACFDEKLGDHPLGAVDGANVAWDLDGPFFKTVGLTDEDRVFNAGVLLLNAELWRETGLIEQTLEFGHAHSASLQSADQTILNALFSRKFHPLPKRYNLGVAPAEKPVIPTDGIFHFVGSPKPWDPLGGFFHGNAEIWREAIHGTRFRWSSFLARHMAAYGARGWILRRSYLRTLRSRLKTRRKT